MSSEKSKPIKTRLHTRNRNRERYDLDALMTSNPELVAYVKPNKYGDDTVDFSNPAAVKALNKALLNHYYGIKKWEFPDENLCPPIPGRADYLHHMADLLSESNFGQIPVGDKVTCVDIGVGASCIYPIIGVTEYGWKFIGSDVDPKAIESARQIIKANPSLINQVECRLQKNPHAIFKGILGSDEKIDLSICNPPFHASMADAEKGTRRKVRNLSGQKTKTPQRNFAGISNELIYEGGESRFIANMIRESKKIARSCYWFSTLVSKQSNLKGIYRSLEKFRVDQIRTIPMGTGNKSSRIVAWSFLDKVERKEWNKTRSISY